MKHTLTNSYDIVYITQKRNHVLYQFFCYYLHSQYLQRRGESEQVCMDWKQWKLSMPKVCKTKDKSVIGINVQFIRLSLYNTQKVMSQTINDYRSLVNSP